MLKTESDFLMFDKEQKHSSFYRSELERKLSNIGESRLTSSEVHKQPK